MDKEIFRRVDDWEVDDKKGIITDINKYHGRIALMCPFCFEYWLVDCECNATISIDSIIDSYNDNETSYKYEDGSGKYCISPGIQLSFIPATTCPHCNSDRNLIAIDPNIAETIQEFNRRGFYTSFSCEGHFHDEEGNKLSYPYIIFCNISKESVEILKKAFKDSKYWIASDDIPFFPYYEKSEYKLYRPVLDVRIKDDIDITEDSAYLDEILNISKNVHNVLSNVPFIHNIYSNRINDITNFKATIYDALAYFRDKLQKEEMSEIFIEAYYRMFLDNENKET